MRIGAAQALAVRGCVETHGRASGDGARPLLTMDYIHGESGRILEPYSLPTPGLGRVFDGRAEFPGEFRKVGGGLRIQAKAQCRRLFRLFRYMAERRVTAGARVQRSRVLAHGVQAEIPQELLHAIQIRDRIAHKGDIADGRHLRTSLG